MAHPGLQAETVALRGHNGDEGEAYYARPLRPGKVPGVVVIHHMPGWDEWTTEVVRKIAAHGYSAIAPHLFFRYGPGQPRRCGIAGAPGGRGLGRRGEGRRRGGDGLSAGAAQCQRQGRRDRILLGRAACLSGRLHTSRYRCRGRLLGRPGDRARSCCRSDAQTADRGDKADAVAILSAARHFRQRRQNRTAPMSTAPKPSLSGSARPMNSIAMMAPATASSRTTGRPTDRSRPWTAGKRFSLSLKNT